MATAPILPEFTPTYHHEPYPAISPLRPELSTKGKSVVVTGAAGGIGTAVSNSYMQSGVSDLFLIDLYEAGLTTLKESLSKLGEANLHIVTLDITDSAAVKTTFEKIEAQVGKIDVLINNAGYLNKPAPAIEVNIDEWFRCFEINVKGSFTVAREFLRHAKPEAAIINLSSCMAHHGVRLGYCNGHSAYCASKLAITKVMDILQEEHPSNRIYNIHPGLIKTASSAAAGNTDLSNDSGKNGSLLSSPLIIFRNP